MEIKYKTICFGEPLIRFQNKNDKFFGENHEIKPFPGGSETNTALGLTKLGLNSSFVLSASDIEITGDYLAALKNKIVDVTNFVFSGERCRGCFLFSADSLTKEEVVYDRAYSSFYQLKKGNLDWTAISPALSQHSTGLIEESLQKVSEKEFGISIDLNH